MPRINRYLMKHKMKEAFDRALNNKGNHDFGTGSVRGSKDDSSPKRSKSGLYYMDCKNCKRCIFEDGTGSAAGSNCTK